jgi:lipopolysaccharide export system permease protein
MLAVFSVIAVVFDLVENIGRLITNGAPLWETVKYYAAFCFFFANLLSGFIVFLTIVWFTSRLAQQTEIIAMLSGGMPFRRFLRPYFLAASFLVALSLLLTHLIVPLANQSKLDFEMQWIHVDFHVKDQNLYREVSPGTIAYFRSITYSRKTGYRFQLERWNNGNTRLEQSISAAKGTWMEKDSLWRLVNVHVREFNENGTESFKFVNQLDTILPMKLDDFAQRVEFVNSMTTSELSRYIDKVKLRGADTSALELAKHARTSTPFAIFVLTLIGVGISARKQRGGIGVHLFIAVLVGFTFVFTSRIISVYAATMTIPDFLPVSDGGIQFLAAWLPNLLYLCLGFYIYAKAPK